MENTIFIGGWAVHPRAPLHRILSALTQLTALKLGLALRGQAGPPLELPQLQALDAYLTWECRPAHEYASLQSTMLTRLTLWGDTLIPEDFDLPPVSNLLLP